MSQDFWWVEDKGEVHSALHNYISSLGDRQSYIHSDNLKYLRLYGNYNYHGMGNSDHSPTDSNGDQVRVTWNIVASMIDTVVAKITKNRPRPMFLTDDGDYSSQKKAENLNKFIEGSFYKMKLYDKGAKSFLDACVFGTGFIKFFISGSEIECERVFPNELFVDAEESIYNNPRNLYQTKWMHRSVLKKMFPKFKNAIDDSGQMSSSDSYIGSTERRSDMVNVLEAWHLPSEEDGKDGRHVISIEQAALLDEDYNKSYFPFGKQIWSDRLLGYFGQGIAEQLKGIQFEINKILRTISVAQHLVSIPKVMVESGSKIVKSHLNNEIGGVIVYSGTKPSYETFTAVPTELYNHLERLYTKAYELIGISQLSATSKKPSGLDSGVALREFNDIETERFVTVGRKYEQFYLDCARIIIDLATDLSEAGTDYSVQFNNNKFLQKIKFSEIKLDEDAYEMQCFPTSFLPSTPSGKLQSVQELINSGMISKEDGIRLLDFPDLSSVTSLMTAQTEIIDDILEKMVDSGNYLPPEPFYNLTLALQRSQLSYMKYKLAGVKEDRLELLRRFMGDTADLLKPPAPPAPPMMPESPEGLPPEMEAPPMEAMSAPEMGAPAVTTPQGEVI